jgi:polyisoprenoid-binding protein YceI
MHHRRIHLPAAPIVVLLLLLASPVDASWKIDKSHSFVHFTVVHMMVTDVRGEFSGITGAIDLDEKDLTKSKIDVKIDVSTVDTRNKKRDGHLKSDSFFDAANHPQARFLATKIVKAGKGYQVTGQFTLRGVTKEIKLDARISEPMKTLRGNIVRGVHAEGTIKRDDYAVSWNKTLDNGGLLVSNEVKISIDLELIKEKSP